MGYKDNDIFRHSRLYWLFLLRLQIQNSRLYLRFFRTSTLYLCSREVREEEALDTILQYIAVVFCWQKYIALNM